LHIFDSALESQEMNGVSENCCPCPTTSVTEIPGAPGADGVNAFTVTTETMDISGAGLTVKVEEGSWTATGQTVFITDGILQVHALVGGYASDSKNLTLVFARQTGDDSAGTMAIGASVVASGEQGAPEANTFADGKTTGTTKATAQTNLGLGQDAVTSSGSALAQTITASNVQVGSIACVIPAAGSYLIQGSVTVDFLGTTFATSRTITLKVRNVTQGVDIASITLKTQILTTLNLPSHTMVLPISLYAAGVAADSIQMLITIDVINTAGTLSVGNGQLSITPLRKS
jgi:hypothetical protein